MTEISSTSTDAASRAVDILRLTRDALAAALSLGAIYVVAMGGFAPFTQRAVPMAVVFGIASIEGLDRLVTSATATNERPRDRVLTTASCIAGLGGLAACIYVVSFQSDIVARTGLPTTTDVAIGVLGVISLLLVVWRYVGGAFALIGALAIAYTLWGNLGLPYPLGHMGFSVERTFNTIWTSTEGVFGSVLGTMARVVMIFILFGAFLEVSGAGKFFIDLALGIGRRLRSGPAIAGVISSGFMGTINGSAVANIVSTGSLTIPLMKRMKYSRSFSAAIETAASTGGQILPPVMGAAAFLMAQTIGRPYTDIVVAATIPALLYFAGVAAAVHLQARRTDIATTDEDRRKMPTVRYALRSGGVFLIPLVVLIWNLISGRSVGYSALMSMGVILVITVIRQRGKRLPGTIWKMLVIGGRNSIPIWLAIAAVGLVLGALGITGLGNRLSEVVLSLAGGSLLIALLLTMIASIVLGMGLPTSAAYLLLAVIVAPAVVEMGPSAIQAHLFILYFGCLSVLTPPVAVGAYIAAGMAGAKPLRTAFDSLRLAFPGFVIPFIFVYDDAILAQSSPVATLWPTFTALLATVALAASAIGHLYIRVPWWERLLLLAGALVLIVPTPVTDVIGIAIFGAVIMRHAYARRRSDAPVRLSPKVPSQ